MSNPAPTFDQFDSVAVFGRSTVNTTTAKLAGASMLDALLSSRRLADSRFANDGRDNKLSDYLLLAVLSLLVHGTLLDNFQGMSLSQEMIEPVKIPPKVQITLSRPQLKPIAPPPPVQVPPKPVVQKLVPLKPQKPKPVAKIVDQTPAPTPPAPSAIVAEAPTPAPAPPAPVVEEKITAPIAGADYLHNPAPEYPEIAMDRGWEGKVLMKVHVQPTGKPDEIAVIKSSGQKVLDDAAVKTVNRWSFVPAKRGETPIAGWVTVPITFNLS